MKVMFSNLLRSLARFLRRLFVLGIKQRTSPNSTISLKIGGKEITMVQLNVTLTADELIKVVSGVSKVYKQKLTVQHSLEDDSYEKYSSKDLKDREESITIAPTDVVILYPRTKGAAVIGSVTEMVTLEPEKADEEVDE